MQAKNPSVCEDVTIKIREINVEEEISPSFENLDSSGNIVTENNNIYEICAGETVNFDIQLNMKNVMDLVLNGS